MAKNVYQVWMVKGCLTDVPYNNKIYLVKDDAQKICNESKWPQPELYVKELELVPSCDV